MQSRNAARRILQLESLTQRQLMAADLCYSLPNIDTNDQAAILGSAAQLDASMMIAPNSISARPTKGVQLVLLSRWSSGSVDRFLEVAKSTNAPNLQFSFVPHFGDSGKEYANATKIIKELATAGKATDVVVHLGFHDSGNVSSNTTLKQQLSRRVDKFKDFLQTPVTVRGQTYSTVNVPGLSIHVSTSLEDHFASKREVENALKLVAAKMKADTVNKLTFRYSPDPAEKSFPINQTLIATSADGKSVNLRVLNEYHGQFGTVKGGSSRDFQVYSNDGVFVRSAQDLNANGKTDESTNTDNADSRDKVKPTLDQFIANTQKSSSVMLLWRPAYNLFTKTKSAKFDVDKYEKPSGSVTNRQDDGRAFDALEQRVLRKFLGI